MIADMKEKTTLEDLIFVITVRKYTEVKRKRILNISEHEYGSLKKLLSIYVNSVHMGQEL